MGLFLFFILPILLACISGYFISSKVYKLLIKKQNKYAMFWKSIVFLVSGFLIWIGLMAIIISQVDFQR
jgi:cell division protein FtsW (lipid II flippase)